MIFAVALLVLAGFTILFPRHSEADTTPRAIRSAITWAVFIWAAWVLGLWKTPGGPS